MKTSNMLGLCQVLHDFTYLNQIGHRRTKRDHITTIQMLKHSTGRKDLAPFYICICKGGEEKGVASTSHTMTTNGH